MQQFISANTVNESDALHQLTCLGWLEEMSVAGVWGNLRIDYNRISAQVPAFCELGAPVGMIPVRDLWRMYAQASLSLTREESTEVLKLAEVGKDFLLQRAKAFVRSAAGRPLLYCYSSDGTPMLTTESYKQQVTQERSVRREGCSLHELLVERCAMKYHGADGADKVCYYTRDPVPMDNGKTAWCMYSAAVSFFPLCRELAHQGIIVSHYCFDRAAFSALERKMKQRHALHYKTCGTAAPPHPLNHLLYLCDWVVSTGCGAHDCQNSLKWSVAGLLTDASAGLKDLFIVVASLKNSFDLLVNHMPAFLREKVAFQTAPCDHSEVSEFWCAMGVEPDVLEVLCDLQPVWQDGTLWISNKHRDSPNLMEQLSGVMLYLFRFRKFSESRWTTIGESARVLVGSLAIGLEGLVRMVRESTKTSDFHIAGFARFTPELKHFCAVATVAARVPDSILAELLEDDRVVRNVELLENTLVEESAWVCALSHAFWIRLANVVGDNRFHRILRSDCIGCASIGAAYIQRVLLSVAKSYPWALAIGDIESNLARLEGESQVSEPVTLKIQTLARQGFNRAALVDGISLLRECHWSTISVEQGHGSAAAMHRVHKRYGLDMLMARSFLNMAKPLLATDDTVGVKERAYAAKLGALSKKSPKKITGRHLFLQELVAESKAALPPGRVLTQAEKTEIMTKHGALWLQCPLAYRQGWDSKAVAMAAKQEVQWQGERDHLLADMVLSRQRTGEEALAKGQMCRLSAAALTETEVTALQLSHRLPNAWGRITVERLRSVATAPPTEPPPSVKAALESMGFHVNAHSQPAAWCKTVCRHRQEFARCALLFRGDGSERAYAFLYASKSPMFAGFAPLCPVEPVLPCSVGDPLADISANSLKRFAFNWTFKLGGSVWDKDISFADGTEVWVLPQLVFMEGLTVSSDSIPIMLEEYIFGLPEPTSKQSSSVPSNVSAEEIDPELLARFPWLADIQANRAKTESQPAEETVPQNTEAYLEGDLRDEDDDVVSKAFSSLMEKRREWEMHDAPQASHFLQSIHSQGWTSNKDVAFDSARGQANGQIVQDWCRQYSLPTTATFAFTRHGEYANSLAREWCERVEYFYSLFLYRGGGQMAYTAEDIGGYEPREEFQRICASLPPKHPSAQRAKALRTVVPRLVQVSK